MQRLPELRADDTDDSNSLGDNDDGDDYINVLNDDDDDDDDNFAPTAPPLSDFDLPPGYEAATFKDDVSVAPPAYETLFPVPSANAESCSQVTNITMEEAQRLLIEYVLYKSCYGTAAAREMIITQLNSTNSYHYILETLGEQRKLARKYLPYNGQSLPVYSYVPGPWEIPAVPPLTFTEEKKKIDIEETKSVKICHKCSGKGKLRCSGCKGHGKKKCTFCGGRGRRRIANKSRCCSTCGGRGTRTCFRCSGRKKLKCKLCNGCKQLLHYIQLIVEWKPYKSHRIIKKTTIPDSLLRSVQGEIVFSEERITVQPLSWFWEPEINSVSSEAVASHIADVTSTKLIVRQHHSVKVVPVTEVLYSWKNKRRKFFVYGSERKVYAPHYPQNCCYVCNLL